MGRMISSRGVGLRLLGKIDAEAYKQIIQQQLVSNLHLISCQPSIFMQDNGPCHKAKKVMSYFEEKRIDLMEYQLRIWT